MAKVAVLLLSFVFASGLWWAVAKGPLRSPEDALRDFYEARDRAEDQLMDPLIRNGRRVVPLVIAELPNMDVRRRGYAIMFLGNGGYHEALPMLERVLLNESEENAFRADALQAIFQISPQRARDLAPRHMRGEDLLGRVARKIVAGRSPVYWTRSYWQAVLGTHE